MSLEPDETRLDDPAGLEHADPGAMLRAVASAGAQVRVSARAAAGADVARLGAEGRPRAIAVAGVGGSAMAGDVLAAVCGVGCPIPVVTVRSYQLPGWIGATDLVIAVSGPGDTEQTLDVARQAVRRGCRLLAVGPPGAPLADIAVQAGAPFVPVVSAGTVRSTLWGLTTPLLGAAARLGLLGFGADDVEELAGTLEELSHRCRPDAESFGNPGKVLAGELVGTLPMIWGTSSLAAVAARRLSDQLAENAKHPSVVGELPEAAYNQPALFAGRFGSDVDTDDFFRDRVADPDGAARLRLVVLRDAEEHPGAARRREAVGRLAADRGVQVSEIAAEGTGPLRRIASLIAVADYASVYLALVHGVDPTPTTMVEQLNAQLVE